MVGCGLPARSADTRHPFHHQVSSGGLKRSDDIIVIELIPEIPECPVHTDLPDIELDFETFILLKPQIPNFAPFYEMVLWCSKKTFSYLAPLFH